MDRIFLYSLILMPTLLAESVARPLATSEIQRDQLGKGFVTSPLSETSTPPNVMDPKQSDLVQSNSFPSAIWTRFIQRLLEDGAPLSNVELGQILGLPEREVQPSDRQKVIAWKFAETPYYRLLIFDLKRHSCSDVGRFPPIGDLCRSGVSVLSFRLLGSSGTVRIREDKQSEQTDCPTTSSVIERMQRAGWKLSPYTPPDPGWPPLYHPPAWDELLRGGQRAWLSPATSGGWGHGECIMSIEVFWQSQD